MARLAGLAYDTRLDWNPDDKHHWWLRFFQDSINETPLAANRGFEGVGVRLESRGPGCGGGHTMCAAPQSGLAKRSPAVPAT